MYFGGVEDPTNAPEGQPWRHLFDATTTWQATDRVALAAQADAGFEPNRFGTSRWFDGAGYVRIQPTPRLYVAARLDYFHEYDAHDADGAASRLFFPANDVGSGTLTADFRPADNLSVRLEYRDDRASAPMYFRGQVATDVTTGIDVPTCEVAADDDARRRRLVLTRVGFCVPVGSGVRFQPCSTPATRASCSSQPAW